MKLLLTSAGFTTQTIIDVCVELVGKPAELINIAVINEGYAVEAGDHTWVIDELALLRKSFGGRFELVNLLALSIEKAEERIEQADMIYVVGGNTDYLMHIFETTGFAKLLPRLLKTKIYVGSSAGSMVMGNRVSSESYQRIYGEGDTYGIEKYLDLVDLAIKPHLNSPDWPNNREPVLLEVTHNYTGILCGLSDASALVVSSNDVTCIGADYIKIQNGTIV